MRENTNPEQIQINDFKGLATTGGQYALDPSYLNYLTNATVTKDGKLVRRQGSRFFSGYEGANLYIEQFRLQAFDNEWIVIRDGVNFGMFRQFYSSGFPLIERLSYKSNVLRTQSQTEAATYASVTNGDYCHVLIATPSTQLIGLTIIRRSATVATIIDASNYTFTLNQRFNANMDTDNTKVYNGNNNLVSTTVSQSGTTITVNRPAHGLAVGAKLTTYTCFWTRYCDSANYPGVSLWGSALRRNSVPLDVNMEIPEPLRSNYIYNEPLTTTSWHVYSLYYNPTTAAFLNVNTIPNTPDVYYLSDGAYRAGSGQPTVRTANFVAFGGLQPGNINTRVYIARWRNLVVAQNERPQIANLSIFVDKAVSPSFRWLDASINILSSGVPFYWGAFGNTSPVVPAGCREDAVVEMIHTFNAAGAGAVNNVVDLDVSLEVLQIGDGWVMPLYGYNLLCNTTAFRFPQIVRTVGNRVVLTGTDNRVLVSSSEFNYRGLTHNNFQVSSLNFNESSAYLLGINQSNTVKGITDVNGVIIVATDSGIFRISGRQRTESPNAVVALVAKVSNQVISNDCLIAADNLVFFANRNGLFQLEYNKEIEETAATDISLPVSNLFNQIPFKLTFSRTLYSIVVEWTTQKQRMLRYDMQNRTFSYIQLSISNNIRLPNGVDGFWVESSTGVAFALWDDNATSDLENIQNAPNPTYMTLVGNSVTITTANTNCFLLVNPPELLQTFAGSGNVVPGYGYSFARAIGSTVVVTEANNSQQPKPIYSAFTTKDLYTDKLTRAMRVRNLAVVLSGSGTSNIAITPSSYVGQQSNKIYTIDLLSNGTYTIGNATAKSSNSQRWLAGDSALIQLEGFDNADAFRLSGSFSTSLQFIGFGFDVSSKQNKLI